MKNLFLTIFLLVVTVSYSQIGVSLGYGASKGKVTTNGLTVTSEESSGSFGIGLFADLEVASSLDFQPYISYGIGEKVEDESNTAIGLGGNLDLYPTGRENGLFLRGGIGVGISLMDIDTDLVKKSSTSGVLGLGIDVSDGMAIVLGYGFSLSDSSNISDIEIKASSIGASLQFKF